MPPISTRPYWLDSGTEQCFDCTHRHVLQMEFRCVGCDAALCEQCVVIVLATRETLCKRCSEEES